MGESNGAWGDLVEHDEMLAEAWDGFDPLPQAGVNDTLDAFVARKNITIEGLSRLGARLSDYTVLAFPFPGGVKYRNMESGQRWNSSGSEFTKLKIVRQGGAVRDIVIIAEGETDAARLTFLYDADVAVLPAGAKRFTPAFAEQLAGYKGILAATDTDEAGMEGLAKIQEHLPAVLAWPAPDNPDHDWCGVEDVDVPPLPTLEEIQAQSPDKQLIVFGDLAEFDLREQASWFDGELLPIGGQLVIHGWAKSYKSFLALDMLAALAQGHDWAGFEPMEEPCKVCVVQWEIKAKYYRDRLRLLQRRAGNPRLFAENFGTWTPLQRPTYRAGSQAEEAKLLAGLVSAGVQVVLFDPVRRALGSLDPNSEKDIRYLLGFFERLQDEGITVIFVHHDNKAAAKAGGTDSTSMTGSGAFAGDADTLVHVGVPKGHELASPYRNLHFDTRNAETPSSRGFEILGEGNAARILYSPTPHGDVEETNPGEPAL